MQLKRRGLIATIVYHALLLMILVFAGLTFPDPPPEEEGILVNFGTDEFGLGDFEPMGDDQQAGNPDEEVTQVQEPIEEAVEEYVEPVQETREAYTPPEPVEVDQTQDVEEVQVKEEPKPTAEELERQRQEQERIERERQEEQERIEQERIERERIEQERIEQERRDAQAERLNNMGRDAFGNQGVGETEGSEGITQGDGNQGDPNGSPNADNYGTGGGLGNGITVGGLGSRKGSVPKPNVSGCEVTQKIEIRVDIQVDKEGRVVSASVGQATYQDQCLWETVVAAAKQSRFTADQSANYRQTGWIKYIIVP